MRTYALRAAAAVVSLVAVACGGGQTSSSGGELGKPAGEILTDAANGLRHSHSYHLTGEVSSPRGPVMLDLRVSGVDRLTGTLTSQGVQVDIVADGANDYLRGRDLWRRLGGDAVAKAIGDGWAYLRSTDPRAARVNQDIGRLSGAGELADQLQSASEGITVGAQRTVDGIPVVILESGPGKGSLAVALTGTTRPIQLTRPKGDVLHFSDYDVPVNVAPPAGAVDATPLLASASSTPAPAPSPSHSASR